MGKLKDQSRNTYHVTCNRRTLSKQIVMCYVLCDDSASSTKKRLAPSFYENKYF